MKKPLLALTLALLTSAACKTFGPAPTVASQADTMEIAQDGAPFIDALTSEQIPPNPQPGETYALNITMSSEQEVLWGFDWCTKTQLQLKDNWDNMSLAFGINNRPVEQDNFLEIEQIDVGLGCRRHFVALTNWPVGKHLLTTKVTFRTKLDDGFYEYPRGTLLIEHHVSVSE